MKKSILFLCAAMMLLTACEQTVTKNDYGTFFEIVNETSADIRYAVVGKGGAIAQSYDLSNHADYTIDYKLGDAFFTDRDAFLDPGKALSIDDVSAVAIVCNDTAYYLTINDKEGMFYTGNYVEVNAPKGGESWRFLDIEFPRNTKTYRFVVTSDWLSKQDKRPTY